MFAASVLLAILTRKAWQGWPPVCSADWHEKNRMVAQWTGSNDASMDR